MVRIGLIGGTGLEKLDLFEQTREIQMETPYGSPSSSFLTGKIENCEVFILSRHGRQHTLPPARVNNRANMEAFQRLGCKYIIATTACGSLREEINRGDLVIPDQFIDFTRFRDITFYDQFEPDAPKHTPMADPFSPVLRNWIIQAAKDLNIPFHPIGTVVTIEGPRFSTRAESRMFRLLGADVINMSTAPEAILANEVGIPYASIALSTDYDCWKQEEEPVTWENILQVFNENVKHVTKLLLYLLPKITE